ncbi:MAG: hypothetical protein QOK43_3032 [Acidimicrobiaceae bacterium]|nr:hypothetical protein [Acidimicrobiaceae bacterium]
MFLFVTQSFCDTGTNEMVFRNFLAQAPLAPKDFSVQPSLKSARLSATTTVNGTEQRQSNCSAPSGPVTTTSLGQSTVTVNAQWLATGPAHEVQPGITARNATATGSITGTVLNPGSLGTSQTAELREVAH